MLTLLQQEKPISQRLKGEELTLTVSECTLIRLAIGREVRRYATLDELRAWVKEAQSHRQADTTSNQLIKACLQDFLNEVLEAFHRHLH